MYVEQVAVAKYLFVVCEGGDGESERVREIQQQVMRSDIYVRVMI